MAKKPLFSKLYMLKLVFVAQSILSVGLFPVMAQASILSVFGLGEAQAQSNKAEVVMNSQTLVLPQASVAAPQTKIDQEEIITVSNDALMAQAGPLGTQADVADNDVPETADIYTYVVKSGDTLPVIAKILKVSVGTIVWANDLSDKNAKLTPGQVLVILPVSGIEYTIRKGDTVGGIAKKYKVDPEEIGRFNGLELDSKLVAGRDIIIPGAELGTPVSSSSSKSSGSSSGSTNSKLPLYAYGATRYQPGYDGPALAGYYTRPTNGCIETQDLHGANGVDIACPKGVDTPILAAASGTVIIAKGSGWNGGFGDYVVINHANGTQTLYGHMSRVDVEPGQVVSQGQVIGLMGSTGRATGKHLHFEVHGAANPFGHMLKKTI